MGEETADLSRAANAVVKVAEAGVAIGPQDAGRLGQFDESRRATLPSRRKRGPAEPLVGRA